MSESETELMSPEDAVEQARNDEELHPHPDFLNFVLAYPDANAATSFCRAATYDSLDRFEREAASGGFESDLWSGGRQKALNGSASEKNTQRLQNL
jgi:hypothetical protein